MRGSPQPRPDSSRPPCTTRLLTRNTVPNGVLFGFERVTEASNTPDEPARLEAVNLYLIRHAEAEERVDGLLDHDRRLTTKGHAQARRLARALERLEVRFDALLSSPLVRAVETANALAGLADTREQTESLAREPEPALLELIRSRSGSVGLVGHEPYMSQLVSLLLWGTLDHANRFEFKKAALYALEWPDQAHLSFVLPPSVVKRLEPD